MSNKVSGGAPQGALCASASAGAWIRRLQGGPSPDDLALLPRQVDPAARDIHGRNALMRAAKDSGCGSPTLRALMALCDPKAVDNSGMSALMLACQKGNQGHAEELYPVSDVSAKDILGKSALDHAREGGFESVATWLLRQIAREQARGIQGAIEEAIDETRAARELALSARPRDEAEAEIKSRGKGRL